MLNKRENLISLYKRTGYQKAPIEFELCPELTETFKKKTGETEYASYFGFSRKGIQDLTVKHVPKETYRKYYTDLQADADIDIYGIAYEKGSAAAKHMTRMRHPLENCQSLEEMKEFEFPEFTNDNFENQKKQVAEIHEEGLAAQAWLSQTVWERAWYIRGMEALMMDMMMEDPMAEYILDKVTETSIVRAKSFVSAGCDILYMGDDIGMQNSIMMSIELYETWIHPRLKKVIDEAKKINPDVVVMYHSCGFVEPFIEHLIEAGIDVLNPVQPESMDFKEIYRLYGDRLSFNGTIGTQTTMPFGTPDDVRRAVFENMELAGDKGGLLACPTHMLEPDVPWENIEAYVKACCDFK